MVNEANGPRRIDALHEVTDAYDAVFCDVWGVLHNGLVRSASAEGALARARADGKKVVLLTNSPRTAAGVGEQLDAMNVSRDAYDALVTSGDVTRALIADGPADVLHIGPDRDLGIFEGLDVRRVSEGEAEAVVATGLFDDETETPQDYRGLLARLAERGLPMICANPDIVVHRGQRLLWCAGALARDYREMGGVVNLAGKPHRPIYEIAMRLVGAPEPSRVIAIGDGLMTDIKGADDAGLDALLITAGIHGEEFGDASPEPAKVAEVLARHGLAARYFMPTLG